jgi:hypothetical protein
MTYIVGWKHDKHAYVCADALLTSPPRPETEPRYSVFGERHIDNVERSTSEVLKLIRLPEAIVAICGNYELGRQIVSDFSFELVGQYSVLSALQSALKNWEVEISRKAIKLIVAAPQQKDVTLIGFDGNPNLSVTEYGADEYVQFGSIPDQFKCSTVNMIKGLNRLHLPPRSQVACLLSVLQGYGVENYMLDDGVGGACCGAYASPQDIKWQDDIGFCIYRRGFDITDVVATSVRDNVFFVHSKLRGAQHRCDSISGIPSMEWFRQRHIQTLAEAMIYSFDYFAFFTIGKRNVTVVQMNKRHKSRLLKINFHNPTSPQDGGCDVEFEERVRKSIVEAPSIHDAQEYNVRLNYFPFEPAE